MFPFDGSVKEEVIHQKVFDQNQEGQKRKQNSGQFVEKKQGLEQ
jgi:hypothetical protein